MQNPKILYSITLLNKLLKTKKHSAVYLVTSAKVVKKLGWAIKEIGVSRKNIILIPDGEAAKEWDELRKLLGKFADLKIDRRSIVIAFGGGSVGDVTGFASSVYLRGIKYVQMPTTLLAQVDSAHGGKTGINFLHYKNQIGSFYQPLAIVLDTRLLTHLPREQVIDGLGEIIKAGLIKDSSILALLKREKAATLMRSRRLKKIIEKSVQVKQYYVARDVKDTGIRQTLNFGHTVGHALELRHKISHGRAVLIGVLQELKISESLGVTPPSVRHNLIKLLDGLGVAVDQDFQFAWGAVLRDKKVGRGVISLPIVEKEGKSKLIRLDLNALKKTVLGISK